MKKLMVVLAMIAGTVLIGISPASAHTPAISVSCDGVIIAGSSYEAKDTNTLSVSIDGGTPVTKTFGVTDSVEIAVPQDGVAHTYTGFVHTTNTDPAFTKDYSGTVGPCGAVKPPNPGDKVVQNPDTEEAANCETKKVVVHHSQTTTPFVYDAASNTYVPGEPVTKQLPDTTRDATEQECPPPVVVPPEFEQYKTTVCWDMHGTPNAEGYSWPQTRLPNCNPTPKCDETIAVQKDVYLIENADEKAYLEQLQTMNSSADDSQIIESWSLVKLTGDECAVDVPPVDVPPVDVPPVVTPPVVTPPVVVSPVVSVVTPRAVDKVVTPPTTIEQTTSPAAQPVQEQGVLPNTGGPDVFLPTIAVLLIAMGGSVVYFARKDRKQN